MPQGTTYAASASAQSSSAPRNVLDLNINKPLPPVKRERTNANLTTITGYYTPKAARGLSSDGFARMNTLLNRIARPRLQRARTEPGLASFPLRISAPTLIEGPDTFEPTSETLATITKLAPAIPVRPRTPENRAPPPTTVAPSTSLTNESLDLVRPPSFREVLSLAVKIAPALAGIVGGVKFKSPEPTSQLGSPQSRRTSRVAPSDPELYKKIFVLTRTGHLIQYASKGSSERLPERMQRLTKDTVAVASDDIPGKPYTVQVAESYEMEDVTRPESPTLLRKMGVKAGGPKRSIPCTLIILPSAQELEQWLAAIRKEIQSRLQAPPQSSSAPDVNADSSGSRTVIDYDTVSPPPLKLTKSLTNMRERSDSARALPDQLRNDLSAPKRPQLNESSQILPTLDLDDPFRPFRDEPLDATSLLTAREMYHRELVAARKENDGFNSSATPRPISPDKRATMQSTMTREGMLEIAYDPIPVMPKFSANTSLGSPLAPNTSLRSEQRPGIASRPSEHMSATTSAPPSSTPAPAPTPLSVPVSTPRLVTVPAAATISASSAPVLASRPAPAPTSSPKSSPTPVSVLRKDSMTPEPKQSSQVVHVANMRKRLTYNTNENAVVRPALHQRSQTNPIPSVSQTSTVSSHQRSQTNPTASFTRQPPAPSSPQPQPQPRPPFLGSPVISSTTPALRQHKAAQGMTRLDNDEYHAFHLDLSKTPRPSPRRHSAIPSPAVPKPRNFARPSLPTIYSAPTLRRAPPSPQQQQQQGEIALALASPTAARRPALVQVRDGAAARAQMVQARRAQARMQGRARAAASGSEDEEAGAGTAGLPIMGPREGWGGGVGPPVGPPPRTPLPRPPGGA